MNIIQLENGNLLVPRRAESDDLDVIGDGVEEITPDDPEYEQWLPFVRPEGAVTY